MSQLEDVDLHYGEYSQAQPWTELWIHGIEPSADIEEALHEFGVVQIEPFDGGFKAIRTLAPREV